jgi:heme-degrading monooxygenase HmoA
MAAVAMPYPKEMTMLVERSELLIKPGSENAFDAAMRKQGIPLLEAIPGVVSVKMGRGVENPDKFILLVEWQSMDAHTEFRTAPSNAALRQVISPFSRGGAMEHFEIS